MIEPVAKPIRSIGVVTPNYPSPRFIERGAFVEGLVAQWQAEGVPVDVVAPISIPNWVRGLRNEVQPRPLAGRSVLSPLYATFSARAIGPLDLARLSRSSFERTAVAHLKRKPIADAYYGHFLSWGGAAALKAGQLLGRPAFAALGESRLLEGMRASERARAASVVAGLAGIVCVSDRLREEAIALGAARERVLLAPNRPDPIRSAFVRWISRSAERRSRFLATHSSSSSPGTSWSAKGRSACLPRSSVSKGRRSEYFSGADLRCQADRACCTRGRYRTRRFRCGSTRRTS